VPAAHAFGDYWTFIILPLARIIGKPLEPISDIGYSDFAMSPFMGDVIIIV
jgi:hypothetical protein